MLHKWEKNMKLNYSSFGRSYFLKNDEAQGEIEQKEEKTGKHKAQIESKPNQKVSEMKKTT